MVDYSSRSIRNLSMLGERRAVGTVLCDLAKDNDKIFAMTADQAALATLNKFQEAYPDRYINMGISEQNAIGVAASLANEGFIPFLTFQAAFASLRCADQVKVCMGYMNLGVKLLGIFSGLTLGECGPTHYALNDIALFRSTPDILVLSPADATEAVKMIEECSKNTLPTYIRLSGNLISPPVYRQDYDFEIGKAITLKEGTDIAIIATGTMVYNSLKAAEILEEKGISAKVINMHTIKPIDIDAVKKCLNAKLIVTVEEHSIYGGLGGAVAEILSFEGNTPKQLIIGISDEYKHAGEYNYLLEQYGLTCEQIVEKILHAI